MPAFKDIPADNIGRITGFSAVSKVISGNIIDDENKKQEITDYKQWRNTDKTGMMHK